MLALLFRAPSGYVLTSIRASRFTQSHVRRCRTLGPIRKHAARCVNRQGRPHLRAGHQLQALQLCSHPSDASRHPAMAAGVSKTLWTVDDVVKVVEEWEAAQAA